MSSSRESKTHRRWATTRALAAIVALGGVLVSTGCSRGESPPERSAETLAVEAKAGDFLSYYETVLQLARDHSAQPDSFRIALDALPGSHLTSEEWDAWVAPYREDPARLAIRLEEVIASLSVRN